MDIHMFFACSPCRASAQHSMRSWAHVTDCLNLENPKNPKQLVERSQVLYVTGTTRRPVPLEHSLYFAGQLYPICRGDTLLPEARGPIACYCFV